MKQGTTVILLVSAIFALSACGEKEQEKQQIKVPSSDADRAQREKDIPLLQVKKGDVWVYAVQLTIPAGVNLENPEEVNRKYEMTRTYIGTHQPSPDVKEVQCFEVTIPGSPTLKEFVEIRDEVILLHGSLVESEPPRLIWYKHPVPFVVAGMKPGTAFPEFKTENESVVRNTDVIAREEITVPGGTFSCIRLLTTGQDSGIEIRKTLWYAPQHGIIREETSRYVGEKLLYRETQELARFTKGSGE
jgi:hypothetical protein